ncbi:MAG: hypothetical protein IPP57_01460 [Candidatus Obscuribacter sp.]|jgi:hypothetical protein|nr:hypothetical protein [Candidatus Obscuribacter sp.]MBK9202991.1 hypothetical protein [Candidatus Obscuribacter sp.]MBK9619107.1 hypothetical protein [Candidatus Obscuribacter sp.]MBK9769494.1 hypothetical protein [Candidatus Obscuribacter sp.]MBL0184595.1 hypothetical protein [Candidatus Obscuribacter sp.]
MQSLRPSSQLKSPRVISKSRQFQAQRDKVCIRLPREQALILYAMMDRLNSDPSVKLEHQAERKVLWDLEYLLHSALPETHTAEYESKLSEARENTWPKPEKLLRTSC